MPRKPQKPREQRVAEEFFPMEADNVKNAVEKVQKIIDRKSLEKIEEVGEKLVEKIIESKPKVKKKRVSKKKQAIPLKEDIKVYSIKKKIAKSVPVEFKPKPVSLKSNGYELVITEKPQAAMKIASALGNSKAKALHGVPYYEVDREGKQIVVACAVGHLFTLSQKAQGSKVPEFDIQWVPNYMVRKGDFSKRYYDTLISLVRGASAVTVATDYDVEGEVIGLNIVRFIAGQRDAARMKYSTLTEKELNESYDTKSNTLNWGQAIAGETRHFLDWFYGINLSRALMSAIRTTGKFRVMSIGRVQGPALNLIVEKEREIQAFKSKKYWQVFITLDKPNLELVHNKDIFDKAELKKFEDLVSQTAQAVTTKTQEKLQSSPPFNLTTLQTEAYSIYGINPARTLQLAQSLYLAGLISYPRTSSQKLPAAIGYKDILKKLAREYGVEKLITKQVPVEGKKTDPAHPSIYPTGNKGVISDDERKIYELIVRRFLSLFMDDAIIENKTIKVEATNERKVGGQGNLGVLTFSVKGAEIKKKSWLEIYPKKVVEKEIPDLNGLVKIKTVDSEEKETQPPRRYSPASIVSELEKRNLGTKATRASILETLYDRGYVKEQSITATPLGISLIETMEKHSPLIIDEALTRDFEKDMDEILVMDKGFQKKEDSVIAKAKETITRISEEFKKQETEIGKELVEANQQVYAQEKEANKLNLCPVCQKGSLQIIYSRKTKRNFIGCTNYPECKNIYSLPPNGLIKKTEKTCDKCGFPLLMLLKKGRKPWFFCFNKNCETNKERLEAYRAKKAQEAENLDKNGN